MTKSLKPARASRSICQTIKALPPALSSGLGQASESGCIRSPRPAAKIIAVRRALMAQYGLGIGHRGAVRRYAFIQQARERRQFRIPLSGALRIRDKTRRIG